MLRDRVLTNLCVIKIFQNVIGYIILIDCKKNYILKLLCLGHTKKKKKLGFVWKRWYMTAQIIVGNEIIILIHIYLLIATRRKPKKKAISTEIPIFYAVVIHRICVLNSH